jgi:15-hydroxyprostaglandin dehydrogenase (NAD)
LTAVILGSRIAISHFLNLKQAGVVVNVASLAGLYPQAAQPVYAAVKAGVVNFTKSLGYLGSKGIRVNAVCPSFAKTALTDKAVQAGFAIKDWVEVDLVIDAFMMAIQDSTLAGDLIRITPQYGIDIPSAKKMNITSRM